MPHASKTIKLLAIQLPRGNFSAYSVEASCRSSLPSSVMSGLYKAESLLIQDNCSPYNGCSFPCSMPLALGMGCLDGVQSGLRLVQSCTKGG